MRYFLFTLFYGKGYFNLTIESDDFPPYRVISKESKRQNPDIKDNPTIMNVFEFENKRDYKNFLKDE